MSISDKIYYQDEWATIYCGDCREILPELAKVDLVLTDFPYGVDIDYGGYNDNQENLKVLISIIMPLILSKSNRALITCGNHNIHLYPPSDWVLAWVNPAGNSINKWGFNCWQPILAYGKDIVRSRDIIIKNEQSDCKLHPCSKPIDFWGMLLLRGSVSKDDLILDPFLGSGTTTYCAKKLNRRSIGIEISEKYCEIAKKRLLQSVMIL